MLDEHSREAFHRFLDPIINVSPKGYREDGIMCDKAIRQGLKMVVEHDIYSPEQLSIKLAQVEGVAYPTVRLKEFIESGKWPCYIDVG